MIIRKKMITYQKKTKKEIYQKGKIKSKDKCIYLGLEFHLLWKVLQGQSEWPGGS